MNTKFKALLLGASAIAFGVAALQTTASAADINDRIHADKSPWQVRVRALGVVPEDDGNIDQIAGSNLAYSNSVTPELDITYFFTDNLAAELILGTTSSKIYAENAGAANGQVGKTWILPPTLTLQYHFTGFGAFEPYVGAGVNYTMFFDQEATGALTDIDIEDTFGAALQVGFDYMLDEHWGVNFDVKKIFLRPDWSANGGTLTGKAKLDPWLIGTGITYRF
ncbi:OmpW family protein [Pseudohoeflea suaedae]|uniref:OmpW family protein n=1 Tax=Pseudohoeflea suaedae TaxID=877384 RepID=A0A4R5PJK3_9HYPH|nr:OmpW family protein [Pseudohoeflea suaedae]TDH35755.1 OmpW family protein [Pseudohoeflea suaedae]